VLKKSSRECYATGTEPERRRVMLRDDFADGGAVGALVDMGMSNPCSVPCNSLFQAKASFCIVLATRCWRGSSGQNWLGKSHAVQSFPCIFPCSRPESSSLVTGSSASQSGHFSLQVFFGGKHRFCGPKRANKARNSILYFSEPRDVAPTGPYFSDSVRAVPFLDLTGDFCTR